MDSLSGRPRPVKRVSPGPEQVRLSEGPGDTTPVFLRNHRGGDKASPVVVAHTVRGSERRQQRSA